MIRIHKHRFIINRFKLIVLAANRGKQLNRGSRIMINIVQNNKESIMALKELMLGFTYFKI